jgi:hypothetical protein
MLSVGMALAGLMGLLVTRLRSPLVLDLLSRWRAEPSQAHPGLEGQPCVPWPLMRNQFEIDMISAVMAVLGMFLIIYYHRRISPLLYKLEDMSLDRW